MAPSGRRSASCPSPRALDRLLFRAEASAAAASGNALLAASTGTAILPTAQQPSGSFHMALVRAAVGFAAVLIALVLLGAALLTGNVPYQRPLLATWLAVELGFWAWCRWWHAPRLTAQPVPHSPSTLDSVLAFRRLLAHARFYARQCCEVDWESYLSAWFKGTPANLVRMGNLREMIAYGFFYSTRETLEADGRWALVEEMARQLAGMAAPACSTPAGAALQEGYTPGLSFMAHLWEPLACNHRLLAVYTVIEALHLATCGALRALGLRVTTLRGLTIYHTRHAPPAAGGPAAIPILFVHGVGVGLLPYILMICRLVASGAPVVAPEFRHVSMRLCARVPPADEVADRCVAALTDLGWGRACVVAHSYGTFVASCLVQAQPERVHSLALIDPVCFGMFLPGLLNTFVYRSLANVARTAGWRKALRVLPLHFVARELHVAATFARRFYWTDVNLWVEDLPAASLVVLAGADELLHAEEVRQVLSGAYRGIARRPKPTGMQDLLDGGAADGVEGGAECSTPSPAQRVLWHPTAGHADWLLDTAWQAEVAQQILSLAKGEEPRQHLARRGTTFSTFGGHSSGVDPLPTAVAHLRRAHTHHHGAVAALDEAGTWQVVHA